MSNNPVKWACRTSALAFLLNLARQFAYLHRYLFGRIRL